MTQRLAELYSGLDEVTLRGLFFEVVRLLPDARLAVIDCLKEIQKDKSLVRTVSLDNLVTEGSGFHVSAPSTKKPKGQKSKIRCNGHNFTCYNYTKTTICTVCGEKLEGLTHQGYQCRLCLLDVHYRCGANLGKCRAPELTKDRKKERKKEKKGIFSRSARRDRKSNDDARVVQLRSRLGTSTADDDVRLGSRKDDEVDATYIVALPSAPGASDGKETSKNDNMYTAQDGGDMPATKLVASPTKRTVFRMPINEDVEQEVEVDSSDNSDYYEENSSDANSDSSDDEDSKPTSFTTGIRRGKASSMKSMARSMRKKERGKTGESADWKRHGASFRARLTAKNPHSGESLKIYIEDAESVATEFGNIPENRVNLLTTPKLTEGKNRYMNILPNNHSRVLLDQIGEDETSSYINANWMKGYGGKSDEFIACQGPLPSTVNDFWRMVWQCNVTTIAMNTGLVELGKEKCERYWPEVADGSPASTITFGDFKIEAVGISQIVPEFQLTKLQCTKDGETRSINHFWWTEWPDKGVPNTSNGIGDFIMAIRKSQEGAKGPAIIHCSAGIGRTGCFLTINYCMHQFDKEGKVDILSTVGALRQDRGMTVQTESQYVFIHKVMLKYMTGKLFVKEKVTNSKQKDSTDVKIVSSRLNVVKSPDRLPGSRLARRKSSREMISKLSHKRSSAGAETRPIFRPRDSSGTSSAPHQKAPKATVGQLFEHGEHQFKAKTFVRPTECVFCKEVLSGLALQGLRCSRCKQDCHFWCLEKLDHQCTLLSSVHRQKSGLPSWPPQRPSRFNAKLTNKANIIEE